MQRVKTVVTTKRVEIRSSGNSYFKAPLGIIRLALIVNIFFSFQFNFIFGTKFISQILQAAICIAFPFFLDVSYWKNWSSMPGAHFLYLSLAVISCVTSTIILILTFQKCYKNHVLQWPNIVIQFQCPKKIEKFIYKI